MKSFKAFISESSDMIRTNSLRNPIHPTEEGIRNFWKWFGNSKAVDDDGRPIVVYHGTNDKFKKINMKKGAQGIFWVTSNKASIASGEAGAQGTSVVMELYVKIESPADWKQYDNLMIDEFKGRGLDGAILPDSSGFVAFVLRPDQVKAVNNKGSFSTDSVLINESTGETVGLLDLYEPSELDDESEVLHNWVDRSMESFEFPVHIMEPDQLKELQTAFGEDTVIDAYNEHAAPSQRKIVKDKMRRFDANRIVVIANKTLIDGNHHVVAAILLGKPVKYINLYDCPD